jgi:hypothetical protein
MKLRAAALAALAAAALLAACGDDPARPVPPGPDPLPAAGGVMTIVLTGVGTPAVRATLLPVAGGTPAGTLQLERASAVTLDVGTRGAGGQRYVQAVFRVRNADASGTPYPTPRQNLTFVPVGTAGTLPGTPVSVFLRQDGTPADPTLAQQLRPAGAVSLGASGTPTPQYPDVVQAFTEAEAAAWTMPDGVVNRFPYGFVVRAAQPQATHRTLPAAPPAGQWDGRVTFAFRIPLAATAAHDPFTIHLRAVAMDDGRTRITQSPEEQTAAGQAAFEERVAALGAQPVLLPGARYAGAAAPLRLCDVRTAGTAAAPLAFVGACPAP